jgi:hypothetical protein
MIVEWVGGAKDGEKFEAPDGCAFVEIIRPPVLHFPEDAEKLFDLEAIENDRVRFDVEKRRNGKYYVHWREA